MLALGLSMESPIEQACGMFGVTFMVLLSCCLISCLSEQASDSLMKEKALLEKSLNKQDVNFFARCGELFAKLKPTRIVAATDDIAKSASEPVVEEPVAIAAENVEVSVVATSDKTIVPEQIEHKSTTTQLEGYVFVRDKRKDQPFQIRRIETDPVTFSIEVHYGEKVYLADLEESVFTRILERKDERVSFYVVEGQDHLQCKGWVDCKLY